jgi:uncharacterized protein (DUF488 family)
MNKTPLFTIGYGARSRDELTDILRSYQIDYLIDVRSRPYSKFKPEFSKDQLKNHLKSKRIQYVYMGDVLGGQPDDPECYVDGKVEYAICKQKPFFQTGLDRLRTAWIQDLRVAVMCSEGRPQDCHRCKLVGEALTEQGINVQHIDESGHLRTHEDVIAQLTGGQLNLLEPISFTSRKTYEVPSANWGGF